MKKLLLKLVWVSLASWLILGAIIAPPEWRAAFLWTGIGLFAAIAVESVLGPCFTPTGLGFYFDARRFHAHVTWRWDPRQAKAPALPLIRPSDLPGLSVPPEDANLVRALDADKTAEKFAPLTGGKP